MRLVDGLDWKHRICGQCGLREADNVEHFILRCDGLVREKAVMKGMAEVTARFEVRGDEEKGTLVLNEGCRDLKAGKAIEAM